MDVSFRNQLSKRPQCSQVTRLTRRSVLLVWDIRRGRRRHAINIHSFFLLQSPSFTILLFPLTFLSEHGLQVFGSSVLILRVLGVLERFGNMEVGELLDEGLWTRLRSAGNEYHGK